MRNVWFVVVSVVAFGGCWVTRAEIRDKIHENDDLSADTAGDTGGEEEEQ